MTDTTAPSDAEVLAAVMSPDAQVEPEGRRNRDALFDFSLPAIVRGFIAAMDAPATETMAMSEAGFMPKLYANWTPPPGSQYGNKPMRVRIVMVSRLGDVGISSKDQEHGYFTRVSIYDLTDFDTQWDPKAEPPEGRLYFAIADKFGSWAEVTGTQVKAAHAPILFTGRSQAYRQIEKIDRFGMLGLQVLPVRVRKQKD